jgi:hypothetical protein
VRTGKGTVRTVDKSLIRSRWAAIGAAVAVTLGGGAVMVASAETAPDNLFTAITPCRLLDTRTDGTVASKVVNYGIRKGNLDDKSEGNTADNDITVIFDKDAVKGSGAVADSFTLQYGTTDFRPIMGACDAEFGNDGDFDTDATASISLVQPDALLLNVTTVNMSANGFVTVYPWQVLTGTANAVSDRPFYSNLNPISSLPSVSNNVTVKLSTITATPVYIPGVKCAGGTHGSSGSNCTGHQGFRVYNENGSTHVIIDVLGYYEGSVL